MLDHAAAMLILTTASFSNTCSAVGGIDSTSNCLGTTSAINRIAAIVPTSVIASPVRAMT